MSLSRGWAAVPQVQIIRIGYRQDDLTEANGTRVHAADASGWTTRGGVRLQRAFESEGAPVFQPYLSANWWHSGRDSGMEFDGQRVKDMYPENRYELKLGVEANMRKGWSGWASLSGAWGAQDYRQYAVRAGAKYAF